MISLRYANTPYVSAVCEGCKKRYALPLLARSLAPYFCSVCGVEVKYPVMKKQEVVL